MEQCKQEAYEQYVQSAKQYSEPLTFEQWCNKIINGVYDIMAGC